MHEICLIWIPSNAGSGSKLYKDIDNSRFRCFWDALYSIIRLKKVKNKNKKGVGFSLSFSLFLSLSFSLTLSLSLSLPLSLSHSLSRPLSLSASLFTSASLYHPPLSLSFPSLLCITSYIRMVPQKTHYPQLDSILLDYLPHYPVATSKTVIGILAEMSPSQRGPSCIFLFFTSVHNIQLHSLDIRNVIIPKKK